VEAARSGAPAFRFKMAGRVPAFQPFTPANFSPTTTTHKMTSELQQAQKVWDRIRTGSPIYDFLLKDIVLVSATKDSMIATLTVGPQHLNSKGGLHGTVSECLIDWAGGLAIAASGLDYTGVSVHIDANFVSTAKLGDELEVEGKVLRIGGSLAYTTVMIYKLGKDPPTVVAHGSHTKFVKHDKQLVEPLKA
jgi:acyl-coenzyme A thioesterase 13